MCIVDCINYTLIVSTVCINVHTSGQMDLCKGWNNSFWEAIGLSDLVQENYARIGTVILTPGTPVGRGLSESAAKDLGLTPGLPVATGVIDAHAGGLGWLVGYLGA